MANKMVKAQAESGVRKKARGKALLGEDGGLSRSQQGRGSWRSRGQRELFAYHQLSGHGGTQSSVAIGNRGIPAVAVVSYDLAEALPFWRQEAKGGGPTAEDLIGDAPSY